MKELTINQTKQISEIFNNHIEQTIYHKYHLTDVIFNQAIEYLQRYKTGLRTLDALHLACCSHLDSTLMSTDKALIKAADYFKLTTIIL